MSSFDFFASIPSNDVVALNREIDDLYTEVEALHEETAMLSGLMAGSFAFFLKHLLATLQDQSPLSPSDCEEIIQDALKRVISSQNRFNYDLVSDIHTTLGKMKNAEEVQTYFDEAIAKIQRETKG